MIKKKSNPLSLAAKKQIKEKLMKLKHKQKTNKKDSIKYFKLSKNNPTYSFSNNKLSTLSLKQEV